MTKWWILIPNTNVVKRKYIKKAGNKFVYKPKLQSIREKPHYKPNALGSEVLSGSGRWRRRIWRISRRESWSWTKQVATVIFLPRKSFASSSNLSLNPSSSIFLPNCAFFFRFLLLFFLIPFLSLRSIPLCCFSILFLVSVSSIRVVAVIFLLFSNCQKRHRGT